MLRYAGIGHRSISSDEAERARALAQRMATKGWLLRSGGALGADSAFASGSGRRELFVPWKGYNGVSGSDVFCLAGVRYEAAARVAALAHRAWGNCGQGARKLLARNAAIVLGADLDAPVDAVLCIARPDVLTGGTRHAMRIARENGIGIFNLCQMEDEDLLAAIEDLEERARFFAEEAPRAAGAAAR